jgi:hypothetical protein
MKKGFVYNNSLTIVFLALFILTMIAQTFFGWKEYNEELEQDKVAAVPISKYFTTGHFIEATFENWESEFLQMALFVLLTISLRQKGSSESKKLDEEEEVDREPDRNKKDAPWPVHKGGLLLSVYKHSLSIVLLLLFVFSFLIHIYGSWLHNNEEQARTGLPTETIGQYLQGSKVWFESFQNWQSEFLSIVAITVLSIYFRQKGSPQSKPVDAAYSETGE